MKYLAAYIGLKVVSLGIWVYSIDAFEVLDEQDQKNLDKLWKYHDQFSEVVK